MSKVLLKQRVII